MAQDNLLKKIHNEILEVSPTFYHFLETQDMLWAYIGLFVRCRKTSFKFYAKRVHPENWVLELDWRKYPYPGFDWGGLHTKYMDFYRELRTTLTTKPDPIVMEIYFEHTLYKIQHSKLR